MDSESGARKLNRIERHALLITLGCTALAGTLTRSWFDALALFMGGVLMTANFHFLWTFAQRIFEKERRKKAAFLSGIFLSFFLFLGAVAVCVLVLKVPVIPFFLGTLALLVAIFLNGLVFA